MAERYFNISGYWKEDKEIFENYTVTDEEAETMDQVPDENSIFYYGLTEENILDCIAFGDGTELAFVIESYEEVFYKAEE